MVRWTCVNAPACWLTQVHTRNFAARAGMFAHHGGAAKAVARYIGGADLASCVLYQWSDMGMWRILRGVNYCMRSMLVNSAATAPDSRPSATVVVAVLGIVSTLLAVILTHSMTARREDRRWSREQEDRARQWQREDMSRWKHDRFALYSKLLLDIDAWRRTAQNGRPTTEDQDGKLEELEAEVGKGVYAVQLLGSQAVADMTAKVWMEVVAVRVFGGRQPEAESKEWWSRAVFSAEQLKFKLEKPNARRIGHR
jgi:hypothetical protein